jgi:hypothetical protein
MSRFIGSSRSPVTPWSIDIRKASADITASANPARFVSG